MQPTITEILAQQARTNHQNLKLLRGNTPHYDYLEGLLCRIDITLVVNSMRIKMAKAKQKNPYVDTTEQQKMVDNLADTLYWMDGLQKQHDYYMHQVGHLQQAMNDMTWLNQVQQKKIDELEIIIKQLEAQNKF